ncbi:unnamed protein product [Blepharisma stoltei]|uniref:Uncharacterized protein n=1 Tax=Blepharisma stoltei TaxID=1481888 RepID=A0AAU9IY44_9CILI|nr:unnamed protein product [Blepharisma stoltei]
MSDYEPDFDESSSSRASPKKRENKEKSPKKEKIEAKPGSLPWEEESMTYSRDDGSNLIRLQRENVQLRNRLKDLSQRLNDIIEITQRKRSKKRGRKVDTSKEELETATKKLQLYEKQWKKLSDRTESLKDPEYERILKADIENDEAVLQKLENNVKKGEASQKKRGKALGGVLSTGETEDMYKLYNELITESTIYSKKLKKIEDRDQQIESSYNEIAQKLNKLESYYDQLKDLEVPEQDESEKKVKDKISQLEREHDIKVKDFNSKIRKLNGRIKELEGEIGEVDKEESELYLEIERRNYQIKEAQNNMSKMRGSMEFMGEKKGTKTPSSNLFETELPEDMIDKKIYR